VESAKQVRQEIFTFLALALVLCVAVYVPIIVTGRIETGGGLGVVALMWAPGIAALATCLFYHRNLRGLGWGLGKARYLALAYVLPAAYALLAYGGVWLLGLAGPLIGSITALGEEIGWRGFLAPRLNQLGLYPCLAHRRRDLGAVSYAGHLPRRL